MVGIGIAINIKLVDSKRIETNIKIDLYAL